MIYIKTCEICEKSFKSITKCRRTCGEKCRKILSNQTRKNFMNQKRSCRQMCESCQRATGKRIDSVACPWARSLSPVDGWEANEIFLGEDTGWSYDIVSCPLYLKDAPRKHKSTIKWEYIK
jgi:hypothetical protein